MRILCCLYAQLILFQSQRRIGNTFALLCYCVSFFGPAFMGSIDYVYNPTDAAWYAAFAPILWCIAFGWIIFTTHIGYRGGFERFFSWPPFSIWTKISYTVYLTQFPVFFYNVGVARTAEHYGFFKILFNLKELLWIGVLSVVLNATSRDALPEYSQYNSQEERNRTRTAPSEDQLIINCRFYLFNN
jgi:peptidoglycan/LPS O-acetylase OafA/YrhL